MMINAPRRVILIEDNPGDIRLTQEAFKESGLPTALQVIEDGQAAMDYLADAQAKLPDLIVLDLDLPHADGREVLKAIKQNDQWRRIPVVILTTSDDDQDIGQSYRQRANCYVTKPSDLDQFVQVIHTIRQFWLQVAVLPADSAEPK